MTAREFVLNLAGAVVVVAALWALWVLLIAFGPAS